jgi:hypothetical protein
VSTRRVTLRATNYEVSYGNGLRAWEVDGTGSGSCPVAGYGIGGVEPSGSTTRELVKCERTGV